MDTSLVGGALLVERLAVIGVASRAEAYARPWGFAVADRQREFRYRFFDSAAEIVDSS